MTTVIAMTTARFNQLTDIVGLATMTLLFGVLVRLDLRAAGWRPVPRGHVIIAVLLAVALVALIVARFVRLSA